MSSHHQTAFGSQVESVNGTAVEDKVRQSKRKVVEVGYGFEVNIRQLKTRSNTRHL